jgi:hypothetical protein
MHTGDGGVFVLVGGITGDPDRADHLAPLSFKASTRPGTGMKRPSDAVAIAP